MEAGEIRQEEFVGLENLGQTAAIELFNDELGRVLENILDPNTDAKTVRTLTLQIKIKPDENREFGPTVIEIKSKLASPKGVGTVMYFGRVAGKAIARERNPRQPELPMGKVADIRGGK